jgi:hypothetical protein
MGGNTNRPPLSLFHIQYSYCVVIKRLCNIKIFLQEELLKNNSHRTIFRAPELLFTISRYRTIYRTISYDILRYRTGTIYRTVSYDIDIVSRACAPARIAISSKKVCLAHVITLARVCAIASTVFTYRYDRTTIPNTIISLPELEYAYSFHLSSITLTISTLIVNHS